MRVLVLASTFPRHAGDTQPRFILDLCRHLPDCTPVVLAPGAPGAAHTETIDGIRVHRFRYAPLERWQTLAYEGGMLANVRARPWRLLLLPLFLAALLFSAWRLARRYRVDLVHAHWLIPQGVAGAALRLLLPGTPLLVTAHGGDVYSFQGRTGRWLKRWLLRRADAVTAVSTQLAADIRSELAPDCPVRIAPMGIDLDHFGGVAGVRRRRFLFVGRLVEKKGVRDLIDAWLQARQHTADNFPELLIAGDGPLRAELEQQAAAAAGGIRFTGWMAAANVARLMKESLALVVPSVTARDGDREGLGLVAAEALAAGTPVIAYDYGAIRDLVTPGRHGLLVPQGDVAALADALHRAAHGALPDITPAQREEIRQRMDWHAVGAGYRQLYGELLSRPRGTARRPDSRA